MIYGNIPRDGGHYTFTNDEKEAFLKSEPKSEKYLFKFVGSKEYINNKLRWILFLKNCPPSELRSMPYVLERVEKVKQFRLSSEALEIQKFAQTPTLFAQLTQPLGKDFIIVPIVSSARRNYIPIGYVTGDTLVNNRVFLIVDTTLYHFGVLTSIVHNAWMRTVAVRLKNDYSYSKDLVYNTFIWPNPSEQQQLKISNTANKILEIRNQFYNSSLADLYDPLAMPPELSKAHQANDKAVWEAYGKAWDISSEEDCVAHLMKLYAEMTKI